MTIDYSDFEKVDIRIGTIVTAEEFPEARKPAVELQVDFGSEIGTKKSSAQVTRRYTLEGLIGRQIAAVVNFPPRQIGPIMSEVLVLGFPDEEGEVCLVGVDPAVPNGGKLFWGAILFALFSSSGRVAPAKSEGTRREARQSGPRRRETTQHRGK